MQKERRALLQTRSPKNSLRRNSLKDLSDEGGVKTNSSLDHFSILLQSPEDVTTTTRANKSIASKPQNESEGERRRRLEEAFLLISKELGLLKILEEPSDKDRKDKGLKENNSNNSNSDKHEK